MPGILIVDDHPIVREGLSHCLAADHDLAICGAVGSVEEAHQCLKRSPCDIALIDIQLGESSGLDLLKDERSCPDLALVRQRLPRKGAPRQRSRADVESWEDVDRTLFERLRAVRLAAARERGVPPYVIFHDATLREMARLRPTSLAALLEVKGVGARKADDLGNLFLSAIRDHAS